MAPQQGRQRKGQDSSKSTWPSQGYDDYYLPPSSIADTATGIPMTDSTATTTGVYSDYNGPNGYPPPPKNPPSPPPGGPWASYGPPPLSSGQASTSSWTAITSVVPQSDNQASATASDASSLTTSCSSSPSTSATRVNGELGYGPPWVRKHSNNGAIYAAAAIIPILVLAIAGGIFFICMRKRKRRRQKGVLPVVTQEMKVQPKTTMQPYLAAPVTSSQYIPPSQLPPTSTPSQIQPVILGPILSTSNGAYLTGMDTSDVVSITSDSLRPINPFTDNSSITEPPPPYRPRSVAPPSFASTSRQSSLRGSGLPPATSRTHLMEGSPFDDLQDDAVSELSEPMIGRSDDTASIVSDLSYQRDPVVGRPTL